MHWNSGRFNKDITVGGTVYITDHKHSAICGGKDYIEYGQLDINTALFGNNIDIISINKMHLYSDGGIDALTSKYVKIMSGTDNTDIDIGSGIDIVSKNGKASFTADGYEAIIKSIGNNVSISAGNSVNINSDLSTNITTTGYINLNASNGITINNTSYGTTLPSTGIEGRVFFKLIS